MILFCDCYTYYNIEHFNFTAKILSMGIATEKIKVCLSFKCNDPILQMF